MVELRTPLEFAAVEVKVRHKGCWSELTSDHNVVIRTLAAKVRDGVIIGIDEVKSNSLRDFRNFMRDFRRSPRIKDVLDVKLTDERRRTFRLCFLEDYESMIMGVLSKYTVLRIRDLIVDGVERISFVVPVNEVEPIRFDMMRLGKVLQYRAKVVDLDGEIFTSFDLSPQERYAVSEAIRRGYYELPRKMKLEDLASQIGLSKPTLEEYLRKAERKLLKRALSDIEFYRGGEFE
ncbi:hypothetical protein HS1genome_1316 [Sulfodiicoccus acidiphilus]|uniref:HTH bat-type domain-containing protein n=1 Tax=Sulfodiicoccus acidiphilus TaxID=1670455 RepID=A0A348B425_9CREN|nr:helix-turn-helix domain-containing protein [Sulfodiicoccus acidiphilus]BBD72927.1 hypothetical protein HS1genome_1316 [Sulfodiicoccus acidiphilus]GGT87941.1 hypothetical protein GCM10007116_02360 [Sulfodiicoccus acidiphilus]